MEKLIELHHSCPIEDDEGYEIGSIQADSVWVNPRHIIMVRDYKYHTTIYFDRKISDDRPNTIDAYERASEISALISDTSD